MSSTAGHVSCHDSLPPCLPAWVSQTALLTLDTQAQGVQEDLRRQLAEVGRLEQAALAKGLRQEAALQHARQETLEAVQQGNHKYASMLAERMGIEDELRHQLASKQQAAATRYQEDTCMCTGMLPVSTAW